jgi:hypothetical protein
MDTEEGPQGGIDRGNSELKTSIDRLNDNLSKLAVPDRISAIPFDNNPLRVVPRTGQPTAQDRTDAELAKTKVSPRLTDVPDFFECHKVRRGSRESLPPVGDRGPNASWAMLRA